MGTVFQTRLRQAMFMRGIKQIEIAEKAGLDRGSVSSYVNGRYMPNAETISKLAKALGVSSDWLLGRSEVKESHGLLLAESGSYGLEDDEQELVSRWRAADETKRQIVRLTLGMKGGA